MRTFIVSSFLAAGTLVAVSAAMAQNAPFCLRGADAGNLQCSFQTMAQCEQAKRGTSNTETCVANPRGTTGSGAGTRPDMPAPKNETPGPSQNPARQ